jgi:hypothetical protein
MSAKKYLWVLAVVCCLIGIPSVSADGFQGSGTSVSPYLIADTGDLAHLGVLLLGDEETYEKYSNAWYRLSGPVDLGDTVWEPIGSISRPFSGHFDGGSHPVTGLRITGGSSGAGLFGYVTGFAEDHAEIRNLVLRDVSISGVSNVGGIAGFAGSADFINCQVTGTITGTRNYVGSIAGTANWVDIIGCSAETVLSGGEYAGGLAGIAKYNSISSSSYRGSVTAEGYAGGIAGSAWNGLIFENVTAEGSVTVTGTYAGGIVGYADSAVLTGCHAGNSVTGISDVGGLVGHAEGVTVSSSTADGPVSGETNTGDLIGSEGSGPVPTATSATFPVAAVFSGILSVTVVLGRKYI